MIIFVCTYIFVFEVDKYLYYQLICISVKSNVRKIGGLSSLNHNIQFTILYNLHYVHYLFYYLLLLPDKVRNKINQKQFLATQGKIILNQRGFKLELSLNQQEYTGTCFVLVGELLYHFIITSTDQSFSFDDL